MKTVVIDSIDRLGRDLVDILNTIELLSNNSVNVESLKEGFNTLLPSGEVNPTAKLIIGVLGSVAEMERTRIKERTREGIEIAKAKGKYTGRKLGSTESTAKLIEKHDIVVKKLKKGLSVREIVKITGKSSATVIKVKKALEY